MYEYITLLKAILLQYKYRTITQYLACTTCSTQYIVTSTTRYSTCTVQGTVLGTVQVQSMMSYEYCASTCTWYGYGT